MIIVKRIKWQDNLLCFSCGLSAVWEVNAKDAKVDFIIAPLCENCIRSLHKQLDLLLGV
jgi:hypothetical protein